MGDRGVPQANMEALNLVVERYRRLGAALGQNDQSILWLAGINLRTIDGDRLYISRPVMVSSMPPRSKVGDYLAQANNTLISLDSVNASQFLDINTSEKLEVTGFPKDRAQSQPMSVETMLTHVVTAEPVSVEAFGDLPYELSH